MFWRFLAFSGAEFPDRPTQSKTLTIVLLPMLNTLLVILKKPFQFLFKMLHLLLGSIRWQQPTWLDKIVAKLAPRLRAGLTLLKANRKKTSLYALSLLLLALASYWGWKYYDSLPKPQLAHMSVAAPDPMGFYDGAKPNALAVDFDVSAAPLNSLGKTVLTGVTLSPEAEGVWVWESDRRLLFTPKNEWKIGQSYRVSIEKTLIASHLRLEDYSVKFATKEFSATISEKQFFQDPKNPKEKKAVFTLLFSHPVNPTTLRDRLHMVMRDKKANILGLKDQDLKITLSFDKYNSQSYVHSEFIGIPDNDSEVQFTVDRGIEAAQSGASTKTAAQDKVDVPGMYSFFRIDSVEPTLVRNEKFEPEQVLIINTTAEAVGAEVEKSLEVYLLPKAHKRAKKLVKSYRWNSAAEVTADVLGKSTRVNLERIPTEHEAATVHSFKFKGEIGRYLLVKIKKGLKSYGEYILAADYANVARIPEFPKELMIMHHGSILSMSGEKHLPLLARNTEAIKVELGRILPANLHHFVTQSNGDFKTPRFENYNFNQENVSETFEDIIKLGISDPASTQYSSVDLGAYLAKDGVQKKGLFLVNVSSWDPRLKTVNGPTDQRLILVTDLGILVKRQADRSFTVFVQSFHSGKAIGSATVEVLGKNGIPVVTKTTDVDGMVTFPDLSDFAREKEPTVIVVKKDGDLSYLPYSKNNDRLLEFSRFDVGGIRVSATEDRLTSFVFSDRGLYRPGDEIRAAFVVRSFSWNKSVGEIPVEVAITGPKGNEVFVQRRLLNSLGFEEIKYATQEVSPTGPYTLSIHLIKNNHRDSVLGSTTVSVQEFLPDRMKITTRLSTERLEGWVSPADLSAKVTLKNLFGTPAQNRRVVASLRLAPYYPSFKKYAGYSFSDPKKAEKYYDERLQDGETNEQGEMQYELDLSKYESASYRLEFTAEGFEAEGGRGVNSNSSVLVSPLEHLVGYKPDGELTFISKDAVRNVHVIAVDSKLALAAKSGLSLALIEQKWVSVLTKAPNGTYKYQSVLKEEPLNAKPFEIAGKGTTLHLPSQTPGDFVYQIKDTAGLILAKIPFSIAGKANLNRGLDRNAELQISLNHTDFNPGEEIEISIKAPYAGAGLITIERERVYAHKWFSSSSATTVEKIKIPADLEGNAYINVSFLRGIGSKEIYMSPLSYGVVPFSISRDGRTNKITLETPDKAKPGEPFKVKFKSTREGKIVIYGIDEGILQVAGYKTPDPLGFFFSKRALQVSSYQILDLILPEYSVIKGEAAPGGDEGLSAIGQNLNPFKRKADKPVTFWSGIIASGPEEKTLSWQMPDSFNGSLKVMAVAVSNATIGANDERSIVRGDFVISPNMPTFVAPGDEFEVSVGISNTAEGSGPDAQVKIETSSSSHFEVLGEKQTTLPIKEGSEAVLKFKVKAKDELGSGSLKWIATSGVKFKSKYQSALSIRPPTPFQSLLTNGRTNDGKFSIDITRDLYPDYRKLEFSASPLPLSLAHGLLKFLDAYPHGCTEQLVSKAFPTLILRNRREFGVSPESVQSNFEMVIETLRSRQTPNGSFGLWDGHSEDGGSRFHSIYALHYLIEARDAGFAVPGELLNNGVAFLKSPMVQSGGSLSETRSWAYALYLLARQQIVMGSEMNLLRKTLEKNFKGKWESDLTAAFMAATYSLYKKEEDAQSLIRKVTFEASKGAWEYPFYDAPAVHNEQLLFLLSKHFSSRVEALPAADLEATLYPLLKSDYNTINSAYAILALDAYTSVIEKKGAYPSALVDVAEVSADAKTSPLPLPAGLFPMVRFSDKAKKIAGKNRGDNALFYQALEAGFDKGVLPAANAGKIEIEREFTDLKGTLVTQVPLGTEIIAHLKLRSRDQAMHPDLAIIDLIPGGFEMVMEKMQTEEATPESAGEGEGTESAPESEGVAPEATEGEEGAWLKPLRLFGLFQPAWAQTTLGNKIASSAEPLYASFVDRREDRIVVYASATDELREYTYKIKAINRGTYVVPAAFVESMYDKTLFARGTPSKISVVDPE